MAQTADRGGELPPAVLQRAAATFGLLASTMRLHIVWLLAQGESDVGTLAERTGGTLQAVSQHLAKLKLAGLVEARREGRHHVYLVTDPNLVTIIHQMVDGPRGQRATLDSAHGVGA